MTELTGKSIVLGVTGGVAAYKAAELARLLVKAGARVNVALTEDGAHFVGPATFQALTGQPVWSDLWDQRLPGGMPHIDLTRGADAILVAPASADFLAKLVQGRANDLLTTLCLARPRTGGDGAENDCPLLVAPAMNRQMW
ncbi:MAG: flavoprotein, partial [Pseudomonadota bacterium]